MEIKRALLVYYLRESLTVLACFSNKKKDKSEISKKEKSEGT